MNRWWARDSNLGQLLNHVATSVVQLDGELWFNYLNLKNGRNLSLNFEFDKNEFATKIGLQFIAEMSISVTKLGDFWNLFTKVSQMFGDFLGSCETHCFLSQNGLGYFFGQLLEKLGLLFISTSGHNDECLGFY